MKKKLRKIWGFRSNVGWKMLVAVIYYAAALVFLWFGMTTPTLVEAELYDIIIYRVSAFVLFLWMLSPAIFLSDTPMRRYLPLFRDRIRTQSLLGMMIVFLLFAFLFAAVDDLHTQAYKDAYAARNEALYEAYEATATSQAEE